MQALKSVGIIGAGTWGIALARLLCNAGKDVTVWSAHQSTLATFRSTHRHPKLPAMELPPQLRYTTSLQEVCMEKDVIVFVVPSVHIRSTATQAAPFIQAGQLLVDAAKGIEAATLLTMSEVIGDAIRKPEVPLVALSGPTHAEEVAVDLPTTIVAACPDEAAAQAVQGFFSTPTFRVYTNEDRYGVEICGALKNVIALAAGISQGLGYGDNAKAALISRGLAELTRLGLKLGCQPATFSGLAGMGDLIVTCTSEHSRNNRCGRLIGQGLPAAEAVQQIGMVVEGLNALPAAVQLGQKYQVELPIINAVNKIITQGVNPADAVNELLRRDLKNE